jgi:DNA-3-methyladenine glycosylase II
VRKEASIAGKADEKPVPSVRLDEAGLARSCRALAEQDPDLGRVLDRWGTPPLWDREPGFATLVHMILEQQVSLASAAAAMGRLVEAIGTPTPETFLRLGDDRLLEIGFSRQKRTYARDLAGRMVDGRLDLDHINGLKDSLARERLMEVKGIGAWTADVYLLMVLLRPDVWPVGDRALVVAARALKGLRGDPDEAELVELGEPWRPLRSVAARMLWHFYLNEIRPPGGQRAV